MFFKNIDGDYIVSLSTGFGQTAITEAEYSELLSRIRSAPKAPQGYGYKLRADSLDWELAEEPAEPEPEEEELSSEEALEILLGGAV